MLFAGLILLAVSNTGVFARVAQLAMLLWLGEISYSLYLAHGFVQFVVTKILHGFGIQDRSEISSAESLGLMLLMLTLCLAFATMTYYGIEIVWRKHLRSLLGGNRRKISSRDATSTS